MAHDDSPRDDLQDTMFPDTFGGRTLPGTPQPTPQDMDEGSTQRLQSGPTLTPGSLMAGRYRIVSVLGVGGMGVVYRAKDEVVGVEVALKVLRPEVAKDADFLQRFRNELVVARQVTHRNVVRIHDIGQDRGMYYMSMDFIQGQSLQDLLKERGQLELGEALRLVLQMARALGEAHRQNVVHRDLKPANILIDEAGEAYISDFGIARSLAAPGMTQTGIVMGTPHYLSPEQARGEKVDGRSDLYTLGIIIVEMLSGKLPFPGGTLLEILTQRMAGQTRSLDELGVEVPPAVAEIIDRCLAKDVEERYQSPGELVEDLEALLEGAPKRSRRLPARRSRSRPAVWAAAALVLLVVGGLAVYRLVPRPAEPAAAVAGAPAVPSAVPTGAPTAGPTAVPPPAEPEKPRYSVAVLPFRQEAGRADLAWASNGVAEMLAQSLAETGHLHVVDSVRVFQRLKDLGFQADRLRDDEMKQVADAFEVNRLVVGQLRAVGDQLRLEARLMEADRPGAPLRTIESQEGDLTDFFTLVERLGGTLSEALEVEAPPITGAGSLTPSPAAMEAYTEGLELLSLGETLKAAPALERAVREDPSFTSAWVRLSQAYQTLGRESQALRAAKEAVRAAGATSGRVGYEARAQEALLRGEPEMARSILEELVENYPNDVEAQVALAEAYSMEGKLEKAIARLEHATTVDPGDPRAWFLLGKYSIQSGDSQRAVDEYLVRALVLQKKLRNEQGEGDVYNAMGIAYNRLGLPDQAIESFETAIGIRERIGDRYGLGKTLYNVVFVYLVRGDFATAEATVAKAIRIQTDLGDRNGLALTYTAQGALEEERGRYPETLEAYRRSLQIRDELGDEWNLAESHNNVGYAYFLLGEYDNALLYHDKARNLYQRIEDHAGYQLALQSIGFCQLAKGQWTAAQKTFLEALEIGRELDYQSSIAVSLENLGRVAHYQGRYSAAFRSYSEALSLLQDLDDQRGQVEVTLHEAEALIELGDLRRARRHLDQVELWQSDGANREQRAALLGLRGRWLLAAGEIEAAGERFAEAVTEAEASHGAAAVVQAQIGAGLHALAAGDPERAAEVLTAASAEARRLGHAVLELQAAEAVARVALEMGGVGEAGDAEDLLRRVLRGVDRSSYAGAYRLHYLLAQILRRRGMAQEADFERREAVDEAARVHDNLDAEHLPTFEQLPVVQELLGDRLGDRPS